MWEVPDLCLLPLAWTLKHLSKASGTDIIIGCCNEKGVFEVRLYSVGQVSLGIIGGRV